MGRVRGVDGCAGGWLCVWVESGELAPAARIFAHASTPLDDPAEVTAVDIPIGLPMRGPRRCDQEGRAVLGDRRSSVFPAPARPLLGADSYESACRLARSATNKALSQQSYVLFAKIREVDDALRQDGGLLTSVREVHPEVSFCFWNGKKPMAYPKKTGFGFLERFRLVDRAFPGAAAAIRADIARAEAADDDILDALAALWTAMRIQAGRAAKLPAEDQQDEYGLPMHIWA